MKRIISSVLAFCMMFSLLSVNAFGAVVPESEITGKKVAVYGEDAYTVYGGSAQVDFTGKAASGTFIEYYSVYIKPTDPLNRPADPDNWVDPGTLQMLEEDPDSYESFPKLLKAGAGAQAISIPQHHEYGGALISKNGAVLRFLVGDVTASTELTLSKVEHTDPDKIGKYAMMATLTDGDTNPNHEQFVLLDDLILNSPNVWLVHGVDLQSKTSGTTGGGTLAFNYAKKLTINADNTVTAGTGNGNVTVAADATGAATMGQKDTASVTATPSAGFKIKSLTVNGAPVAAAAGSTSAYTFEYKGLSTVSSATDKGSIVVEYEQSNTSGYPYTVEHYVADLTGGTFTKVDTQNETATALNTTVSATPYTSGVHGGIDFAGVSFDSANANNKTSDTITAANAPVLKLYYTRKNITMTLIPNDGTNATVTPTQVSGLYGAAMTLPTPANTDNTKVFKGWYTELALTNPAPTTFPATNGNLYAKWDTGSDPIRGVEDPNNIQDPDPNDPGGDKITNPGGYVVPGPNGEDENGGGDDKVITPNAPVTNPDEQPGKNTDGNLELPDGGTDNKGTTYPPCVIAPNGNVVSYLYYVRYHDNTNNEETNITAASVAAGNPTKVAVPANATANQVVPASAISGYVYVNAVPADRTVTMATLKDATAKTIVTLNYTKTAGNDPIRPFDPEHPTDKNPTITDPDWLLPGENGNDENGGGDDKIVVPNPVTNPNEKPEKDQNDNLEIPDGGFIDGNNNGTKDPGETELPPSVVNQTGEVVSYLYYVRYFDKTNGNKDIAAEAQAAGGNVKVTVPASTTANQVVPAVTISSYTFDSAEPADRTVTMATLKGATAKTEVKLYYTKNAGEDPIRAVEDPNNITDPDPADPDGSEITNPGGYVVPGPNGQDENGTNDDKVITPNPVDPDHPDQKPTVNGNGDLVLPDGATDNKGTTYPPCVMDQFGDIVSYIAFVELEDMSGTSLNDKAPAGFQSMVTVDKGSDFVAYPPFIDNYAFDSADPTDKTITSAILSNAASTRDDVTVTLTYKDVNMEGDPIRPYDPATDEPNTDPKKGTEGDFVVPGSDGTDEKGEGDDIIVKPNTNPDTGKSEAETSNGGHYVTLPDGATDTTGKTYPPCVMDNKGEIVAYLAYVALYEDGTTDLIEATGLTNPIVSMIDSGDFTCTIPEVKNYTFTSADPTNRTLTEAELKAAQTRADVTLKLYYKANTVNVVITLVGPDTAFPGVATTTNYKPVTGTNNVSWTTELLVGSTQTAPSVSGYSASGQTSVEVKKDTTTITFTYTKNSTGGGGGGGTVVKNNFALTFDTRGGNTIAAVTKASGTKVDLSTYKPTKPGNTFLGWFSTADEAAKAASDSTVEPTTSVTLDKNLTVYAGWSGLTEDHIAYMVGYTDKSFRPGNNMTRAEAAMMFYRLLSDKTVGSGVAFKDVPASAWYAQAVQVLASKGIITGYTDGTFKPNNGITRAEFAAIASRFENLTSSEKTFTDVPSTFWAYRYINSAATKGWINGYADGTFKPNQNITRAEVVTLVNRVLLRTADQKFIAENISKITTFTDVASSYWAYWDILEAANAHDYTKDETTNAETAWTALK